MSITPGIVAGLLLTEEERKRKEKKPKGLTGKSGNPGNPGEGREGNMAEERKVSPLVIAGIGVGVAAAAAVGLYALARAAPPTPPPDEEIPPPGNAVFAGSVYDASTGYPLRGVKVSLNGLTTSTDTWGGYWLEGFAPGTYTAKFEKEEYWTEVVSVHTIEDWTLFPDYGVGIELYISMTPTSVLDWRLGRLTIHQRTPEGTNIIPTYYAFMKAEMSATNISTTTRVCTIAPYLRHKHYDISWTSWYEFPHYSFAGDPYEDIMEEAYQAQTILSVTLAPGKTGVLSAVFYGGISVEAGWKIPKMQVRFIGPFGTADSAIFDMLVTA